MKIVTFLLTVLLSLSACASDNKAHSSDGNTQQTSKAEVVEVIIQKFKFIPEVVEIKKGQTIRWVNKEKRQYHSVWFEKLGEEESEYLFPDDTWDKTFDKAGDFEYRCGPHPEMIAKVIVK